MKKPLEERSYAFEVRAASYRQVKQEPKYVIFGC